MPTTEWFAALANADSPGGLAAMADRLGFGPPASLDAAARRAIGLPEEGEARVAAGRGTCRLLILSGSGEVSAREQVARLAARLSSRAPHLLWLLALVVPARHELVLAAWQSGRTGPRLAALTIDRRNVLPSDAETAAALHDQLEESDVRLHERWVEVLGREAMSRRFFRALQDLVGRLAEGAVGRAVLEERREVALLHVSRMLFLSFLEARGWLDGTPRFLSSQFDRCLSRGGGFQRRVLDPLFFGTLNTPVSRRAPAAREFGRIPFLNGGLFARSPVEKAARSLAFQDADWGAVFDDLLLRYRFTAREETPEWQEAAVDPEMLGRAFESLMAAQVRRLTGAYFTPLPLVVRAADTAIEALLESRGVPAGVFGRALSGAPLDGGDATALSAAIRGARVLDPACGSGAFLVHVLDRLTRLRQAAGDARPADRIRREVLAGSIFGVDLNPTAVWLCELRLWLALMVDHPAGDPMRVPPLPNLDHNVRCGDALGGGDFALAQPGRLADHAGRLRARYTRATGARKRVLGKALDRVERARLLAWLDARMESVAVQRAALVSAARGRDLFGARRGALPGEGETLRHLRAAARSLRQRRRAIAGGGALPFAFESHFPEAAAAGGFDLVVGNPPWVRLHRIAPHDRVAWRREFSAFRNAAWLGGAQAVRAGAGFGAQVDVASLFVERGVQLLRRGGVLSFLVPSKLWRSLAGGGVRRVLTERAVVLALEDWSDAPAAFDAATYPSLIAARVGRSDALDDGVAIAVHGRRHEVRWRAPLGGLALDASPGSPWVTLPPDAREVFERVRLRGIPLGQSRLGPVTLGVKCGCNEAFLVRLLETRDGTVLVTDGRRRAHLASGFVRPVLRGQDVRAWCGLPGDAAIVFPHAPGGRALHPLPPELRSWLQPWRGRLEARSDSRRSRAWWSLHRLDGADPARPRVVWADIGRTLVAQILPAGDRTVPLNSCYVIPVGDLEDALTLAALLNSALANAWVGAVAEPARGGYRRHLAWTLSMLPVPDDWARARDVLGPLARRGLMGATVGPAELLEAVLESFRLRRSSVSPLLEWSAR